MKKENGWINLTKEEKDKIFAFSSYYIDFLNKVKTEREAVIFIKKELEKHGFKNIDNFTKLEKGDKVFYINKNKSVYASVIGDNLSDGLNIIGSHIDSPRLDLKPNPIFEEEGQVLFKTHYYGGIKKYQWTTIPLAMHGVVIKTTGEVINLTIGEQEEDPIFTITDLLPHLAKNQENKKLNEAIEGEKLNVLIGNMKLKDNMSLKETILNLLKEQYNLTEDDFLSAEIEFVPAFKARSLGFDKSMVASYGQDDRICAYTSLQAFLKVENPKLTNIILFVDKEEIGSYGNTGMMSLAFDNFITKILIKSSVTPYLINDIFTKSKMLSADVGSALDPNYQDAYEKNNSSILGCGIEINKYTGGRGKSSASDANAEYLSYIRTILEAKNIKYQVSELGKIDLGGGGTIAYIIANKGVDVLDCGIPILSMHSPYEVASKFDLYMAYKTYLAFFEN